MSTFGFRKQRTSEMNGQVDDKHVPEVLQKLGAIAGAWGTCPTSLLSS